MSCPENAHPTEVTRAHSRLLKCTLEVDNARAYWQRTDGGQRARAERAFEEFWFASSSFPRVRELLRVFRTRFDAFPPSLEVLHRWPRMSPDTRRSICHWHLQLADPIYRRFCGEYLVARRAVIRDEISRDLVLRWVEPHTPQTWSPATRIHYASKLLSTAHGAGLVASKRDPRPLVVPRVPDEALEYLLYLLRGLSFEGTLLANPYLASVGLEGPKLERQLRRLPSLRVWRQGPLREIEWAHADLLAWAAVRHRA